MVDQRVERCRGCGKPLFVRKGDEFVIRKNQGRAIEDVSVKISHGSDGVISIACSNCPHFTPHYFITLKQKAESTLAR